MSLIDNHASGFSVAGRRASPKPSKTTSPRASLKAKGKSTAVKAATRTKRASSSKHDNKTTSKVRAQTEQSNPTLRAGTKQALLIEMLRRSEGATLAELVKAIRWQAHSIRGAMSGAIKKKLGLAIESKTVDGRGRVYQIAN
jgi:hypothetical protein